MVSTFRQAMIADSRRGEMYLFENTDAIVVDIANTPILINSSVAGLLKGWTFTGGESGLITAIADYSGTVAGTSLVTSATHGLITGDIVSLQVVDYNGIYEITKVTDDSFYIVKAFTATKTGRWDMGSHLVCEDGSEGTYRVSFHGAGSEAGSGGSNTILQLVNATTLQEKGVGARKFATNDLGSLSGGLFVEFAVGDKVFLSMQSDSTNNVTYKYGTLGLNRI